MANKKRPKQIMFRVTQEEFDKLQEKIDKSGKSQQEYILKAVFAKKIINTDGIKEVVPELKRIGNNLNQIAKSCNEGNQATREEVNRQGEELREIWQLLRLYLQKQE